jgi:glycine/D-amino acid oxidase-like deaminating enzyme
VSRSPMASRSSAEKLKPLPPDPDRHHQHSAIPLDPAQVAPDPGAIERLEALCSRLSPALTPSRIIARQACYRPVTQDGLPLIGEVPGAPGAYVATGHSVWGILNAPATAEALSELICDRHTQAVELNPFSPGRRSLAPSRLF